MTTEEKVFYQGTGIYKIEKGDSHTYIKGSSLVPRKQSIRDYQKYFLIFGMGYAK